MRKKVDLLIVVIGAACWIGPRVDLNPSRQVGEELDSLDGVPVYYNGGVARCGQRSLGANGYNIGIQFQCVEFVKRYYYKALHHEMPDSYGHAISFLTQRLLMAKKMMLED